jgi:hypothetical protein
MIVVVDRIEGETVVLEIGDQTLFVDRASLPDAVEGATYRLLFELQPASLGEAEARLARLRARTPPSGNIDL